MIGINDIAIAQINLVVGDVDGNVARIIQAAKKAGNAKLVVFPELTLCGYPPEDLVLKPAFQKKCAEALAQLARDMAAGPALLVGTIDEQNGHLYNAAALLTGGKVAEIRHKVRLPNYGIFDEKRLFTPGILREPMEFEGTKLGVMICEDMWQAELSSYMKHHGAEILVVLNASPYEAEKYPRRLQVAQRAVKENALPLVYVNLVGGQDDIIFDGASFVLDETGAKTCQLPLFEEVVQPLAQVPNIALPEVVEAVYQALVMGLRDYVHKNGFSAVVLGLSGGVDSALVAAIAADALGAENVTGVLLPSPYSSQHSIDDALESAKLLGIQTIQLPITEAMQTCEKILPSAFADIGANADGWMEQISVGGNVQARLRGVLLMALSNASGRMLVSTTNKSELAVGYGTLYGDLCGGYALLKDVYKTQVYALCHWRNAQSSAIPENSITKAPSAELKPGQTDQDQLPAYDVLDAVLKQLVEQRLSVDEIAASGTPREVVEKIAHLLRISEFKRRQAPPGPKVSAMQFGRDRRYPLTNGFKG